MITYKYKPKINITKKRRRNEMKIYTKWVIEKFPDRPKDGKEEAV